jgi:PAS domain S-box-containing protein
LALEIPVQNHERTVLYVEDEAIIALNQQRVLEQHGFTVVIENSGEKAVETACTRSDIDLVIMDIDLGSGIDGAEAARRIIAVRDVPIIFLTSHSSQDYVDRVKSISNYGYVVKNSGEFVLIETIATAFALHDALSLARAQAQRNADILNAISDLVFVFHRDGSILDFKGSDQARFHLPPEEFIGKHIRDILPSHLVALTQARIAEVLGNGHPEEYNYVIPIDNVPTHFHARMVPYGSDETFTIVRDVTPVYEAESSAAEARSRAEIFADVGLEGIVVHNRGSIEFVNHALCELTGYSYDDFAGANPLDFIHPEDRGTVREAITNHNTDPYESRVLRKDGSHFVALLRGRHTTENGVTRRVTVVRDISDSKNAQNALEKQVTEMQHLIEEVQHRIKNNFASIESLLNLKKASTTHPAAATALTEATASVSASRLLYEKLLEIQNKSEIHTTSYLGDIARQVLRSFDAHHRIVLKSSIVDIPLDARRAFPLATLLTELITNVIKYAYPNPTTGAIELSLAHDHSTISMTITDNGEGFDVATLQTDRASHLGINLAGILAQQIGGTFHIESTPNVGTTATVEFPCTPTGLQ